MGKYEIKRTTKVFADVVDCWWQITIDLNAKRKLDSVIDPLVKHGAEYAVFDRPGRRSGRAWSVFVPVAVHEANMTIGGYDE